MGGVDRKDLQLLTRTRLAEARKLLEAGLPDGAYYLAGWTRQPEILFSAILGT